jgi:hypothetical protein
MTKARLSVEPLEAREIPVVLLVVVSPLPLLSLQGITLPSQADSSESGDSVRVNP